LFFIPTNCISVLRKLCHSFLAQILNKIFELGDIVKVVFGACLASLVFLGCGGNQKITKLNSNTASLFEWGVEKVPDLTPPGPGAGEWNSEPASLDNIALARSAKIYLASSDARNRYGIEAAETFLQYFKNNGENYSVVLPRLLADVPRVQALYDELLDQLKEEALIQSEGNTFFTLKEARVSTIERAESENWYLAVAGFSYWISGDIAIEKDGRVSGRITLGFWDRYDWDPGVVIPIPTPFGQVDVDQDRVGEFHRQGLAKEYDSVGSLDIHIE